MKMLNEDISGRPPLKIDVIPAVIFSYLFQCFCDRASRGVL